MKQSHPKFPENFARVKTSRCIFLEFVFKLLTLWPFLRDEFQLLQGYRATTNCSMYFL